MPEKKIVDLDISSSLAENDDLFVKQNNKPVWVNAKKIKEYINDGVDLSTFYTKVESDKKFQLKGNYLTSIPEEYVTNSELQACNYVNESKLKADMDKKLSKNVGADNSGKYLSVSPSGDIIYSSVVGGQDGTTFTPHVSSEGMLSWTNNGGLSNPPSVNIKGLKGDKGERGEQGLQGMQGIQGVKGERGERGERGLKGDKGDPGQKGEMGTLSGYNVKVLTQTEYDRLYSKDNNTLYFIKG